MSIDITEVLTVMGIIYALGAVDAYRLLRRRSSEDSRWSSVVYALMWPSCSQ